MLFFGDFSCNKLSPHFFIYCTRPTTIDDVVDFLDDMQTIVQYAESVGYVHIRNNRAFGRCFTRYNCKKDQLCLYDSEELYKIGHKSKRNYTVGTCIKIPTKYEFQEAIDSIVNYALTHK